MSGKIEFSILGRGKAGRALAEAWGGRVRLLDHQARPKGWVLLAVPDHAIQALAGVFPGRALHMSGCLHLPGVPCAHPLTSFDGRAAQWAGTPLAVTGEVPETVGKAFADLGFKSFLLPEELKPLYHACAVLCSGHAATLWLGAMAILKDAGLSLPGLGLRPLAEASLCHAFEKGVSGRTGPFDREDQETIQKDLAALPAEWKEVFLALGKRY